MPREAYDKNSSRLFPRVRLRHYGVVALLAGVSLLLTSGASTDSPFTELATFQGLGIISTGSVGPGPAPGSERYYAAYAYPGSTAEVVAIDPETGSARVLPMDGLRDGSLKGMLLASDGNLYIGGTTNASLLRLNTKEQRIENLGRPSSTETMIWDLAEGSDGKIYGGTFPNAKLIRYDPKLDRLEDLGRMDATEKYARSVRGDKDGFIYAAIGLVKAHLVAYDTRTGRHEDILPAQYQNDNVQVFQGSDGGVYARVMSRKLEVRAVLGLNGGRISGTKATMPVMVPNRLAGGRTVTVEEDRVETVDPRTRSRATKTHRYTGKDLKIFRLGADSRGNVVATTSSPVHLRIYDGGTGAQTYPRDSREPFPTRNGGEIYSMLPWGDKIILGGYTCLAPLMVFDPDKDYQPGVKPDSNPLLVDRSATTNWRPKAMIKGAGGRVYIGSIAGYGETGGELVELDPQANEVTGRYRPVPNQSVSSLSAWRGRIVGGTSIYGGGGTTPSEREARLFVWDPVQKRALVDLVPVPGASHVTDLITVGDLVFGIAGPLAKEDRYFFFDPETNKVVRSGKLPENMSVSGGLYNCVGAASDGTVYGLVTDGIFSVDPRSLTVSREAVYRGISGGFALVGKSLFFSSRSKLVRYSL